MDALKKHVVPTARLPMLLSELSSSIGVVLRLQLPNIQRKLTTILDVEDNVAGEVKVLENKLADTSVYSKPCNRLGTSAVVTKRKRLCTD